MVLIRYTRRRMPDCTHYSRTLSCPNASDCLYLHRDPSSVPPSCPHYTRGFCPLGPRCAKTHIRRRLCRFYLAGFCPYGKGCREGNHPKWVEDKHLEKPRVRVERSEEEMERERERRREEREREDGEWERSGGRREGRGRWTGRSGGRRRGGY